MGRYPVVEGRARACWVSTVDDDGNEVAGVPLPEVAVPLATHLGWNLRHPDSGGAEQILNMQGATWDFPWTTEEQTAAGDRRTPVVHRYVDRADFLARVRVHVHALVAERYLLESDAEAVIAAAAIRWDGSGAAGADPAD